MKNELLYYTFKDLFKALYSRYRYPQEIISQYLDYADAIYYYEHTHDKLMNLYEKLFPLRCMGELIAKTYTNDNARMFSVPYFDNNFQKHMYTCIAIPEYSEKNFIVYMNNIRFTFEELKDLERIVETFLRDSFEDVNKIEFRRLLVNKAELNPFYSNEAILKDDNETIINKVYLFYEEVNPEYAKKIKKRITYMKNLYLELFGEEKEHEFYKKLIDYVSRQSADFSGFIKEFIRSYLETKLIEKTIAEYANFKVQKIHFGSEIAEVEDVVRQTLYNLRVYKGTNIIEIYMGKEKLLNVDLKYTSEYAFAVKLKTLFKGGN